jgi:glutaredoxin-like protein NrdH
VEEKEVKKSVSKDQTAANRVFLYALSTCGMCRRVKRLLKDMDVEYEYVDVDLCDVDERENRIREMRKWDNSCSFPMLIINNETCVIGDEPDRIKKELGKQ